jgi:hypothetical protein
MALRANVWEVRQMDPRADVTLLADRFDERSPRLSSTGLGRKHGVYDSDDADPGTIAASLAVTLREVCGAHPTDSFRFEPVALVKELLAGNFGPRFMLDTESMGGAS